MQSFKLSEGTGRCIVEANVVMCGQDLIVTMGGGEKHHIGAVAIAVPRNEFKEGKKRTASTSVICVQGHREDEVSYRCAKYLATELDCVVTVTIGAHIDNISKDEFQNILDNINKLLDKVINIISDN